MLARTGSRLDKSMSATRTVDRPAGVAGLSSSSSPRREPFMIASSRLLIGNGGSVRGRIFALYAFLVAANVAAWLWALVAFHDFPLLLGTAALAYSFGLRHAFDADHIAAIDNVTRKLMQEGKRPVGAGLYFSLGHSTIVVGLSVAIAVTAATLQTRFDAFKNIGSVVGTLVSASFLFAIAIANVVVLVSIYRVFQRVKSGGHFVEADLDLVLVDGGLLGRVFRRFFRVIQHSWQMYPLGVLFGLGFDTATEVGLLVIAGGAAAFNLPFYVILVLPVLFAAGMCLMDTIDGVFMNAAYGWAFARPVRKVFYNITITAISVAVALVIGGLETLNLIGDKLGLTGGDGFWGTIGSLNDNFGVLGYIIVGFFIAAWMLSYVIYRLKGYDDVEVSVAS